MNSTATVWASVRLAELGAPNEVSFKIGPFGSSLKKDELVESGIPVVGIENILPNRFTNQRRRFVTEQKFQELADYAIRPGDILVTTMGTIGRAAAVPEGVGTAIIDSHLFRMRLDTERADPSYVAYAINGYAELKEQLQRMAGGAIMAGLNTTILRSCAIPLPPLEDQRRIVGILKEQLGAVERARAACEAQLEAARKLPAAYMFEGFESPQAKAWPTKRLTAFAETRSGATPSRQRADFYGGSMPWVKTGELKDGQIASTEETVTDIAIRQCSLPVLPPGTLLIAMYGQGQTRGRTGILSIPAVTNQACFAILPNEDTFVSGFLQLWFRHNYQRLRAETELRGGNQPNLNGILLREQAVPLPPVSEQSRIVRLLSEQLLSSERILARLEEQMAFLSRIPNSILRDAFGGRL